MVRFGDLPDHLLKFTLTLPHWKENEAPPASFVEMREQNNAVDVETMKGNCFLSSSSFNFFLGSRAHECKP